MTPTQQKAMEMALEAMEQLQGGCTDSEDGTVEAITVWCPEVIEALRAALAERKPLFKPLIDQHPGLAEELAEQDDDKADDKADAERYRWLVGGRTLERKNEWLLYAPDGRFWLTDKPEELFAVLAPYHPLLKGLT